MAVAPLQVLGDADTVLAFALGGVPGSVIETAEAAHAAIDAVTEAMHGEGGSVARPVLLLVTQRTAASIPERIERAVLDVAGPLILEIPGVGEAAGDGSGQRLLRRVLGSRR